MKVLEEIKYRKNIFLKGKYKYNNKEYDISIQYQVPYIFIKVYINGDKYYNKFYMFDNWIRTLKNNIDEPSIFVNALFSERFKYKDYFNWLFNEFGV